MGGRRRGDDGRRELARLLGIWNGNGARGLRGVDAAHEQNQ
jgi:hypothetical protein